MTRFQLSYPVYRVSGVGQRQLHIPDIGIRALQGHSRDDVGIIVLISAQEKLSYHTRTPPEYCVHGTTYHAWAELLVGTKSLMRGCPIRLQQAVFQISSWLTHLHLFRSP